MNIGLFRERVGHALLMLVLLVSLIFATPVSAFTSNTIDTAVDEFSADYWLSKNADGVATAKVQEKITVTYPKYDRNFGFDRELPFLLANGKTEVMSAAQDSFKVTRDGKDEPFKVLERTDDLVLQIGTTDTYLHGTETYTIEYELTNFILNPSVFYIDHDPETDEPVYQELFWNIFGNEWMTSVNNISVNFHFADDLKTSLTTSEKHSDDATYTEKSTLHTANKTNLSVWCYLGNDAETQSRCEIKDTDDGFRLEVKSANYSENLRIAANFKPGTFKVSDEIYHGSEIYISDLKTALTLSKNEDNSNTLKVTQKFSATFPTNSKDHELTWNLPISTAGNKRDYLDRDSIRTTFDGKDFSPERIEYATGTLALIFDHPVRSSLRHEYEISYELKNVANLVSSYRPELPIFESDAESESDNLELVQNLISSGWHYNTADLEATFDLDEDLRKNLVNLAETDNASPFCYALAPAEDNLTCEVEETETGFKLTAQNIKKSNDIILIADFKNGTFAEIPADKSYLHVILTILTLALLTISFIINIVLEKLKKKKTIFVIVYTVISLILVMLLFAAPAQLYELLGMSIFSEHVASFLRYPCAFLIILLSAIITFRKIVESPTPAKKSNKKPKTASIIIATHKKYRMPKESCYIPLRVGAKALDKNTGKTIKQDDFGYKTDATGKNISTKNNTFCELTGLYWAWKNLDTDYIGLAHYRRFLTTNTHRLKTRDERFSAILTTDQLGHLINDENVDIILPKARNYYIENLYSHYIHTSFRQPLDMTRGIIAKKCPEYLPEFDRLKTRSSAHMFNIFIMRKDILNDYCEWLFDILFELEKQVEADQSISYDAFHSRFYGRISELLLDVYLYTRYPNFGNDPKVKELRVINMECVKWSKKGKAFLLAKFARRKYDSSF